MRITRAVRYLLLAIVLSSTHATAGVSGQAAALREVVGFGSNPGDLRMWLFVPERLSDSAPMVVALHGCRQSASSYDDESGWVRYAEKLGFVLLLPEQKTGWWIGNNPLGCFNWFYQGDQQRGRGEALSIKQMMDKTIAAFSIDTNRVYVTGLSAGGAMTAVMLASYPETFAGGAIIAGIPYGCSSVPSYVPHASISYWAWLSMYTDPYECMRPGVDLTPRQWGDRARGTLARQPARWPRISIWQGASDSTVYPANALELVEQWTDLHGTDTTADVDATVKGHRRRIYHNAAGEAVVELYLLQGVGHGTPVDPAPPNTSTPAVDQCGVAADYILPAGICASYYIATFWGLIEP